MRPTSHTCRARSNPLAATFIEEEASANGNHLHRHPSIGVTRHSKHNWSGIMKRAVLAFLGGLAAALGVAVLNERRPRIGSAVRLTRLDLNRAPIEDLSTLGIDREVAERIVENRPYRSKLELLERFIITKDDYDIIKPRISTDRKHANDAVRVAS